VFTDADMNFQRRHIYTSLFTLIVIVYAVISLNNSRKLKNNPKQFLDVNLLRKDMLYSYSTVLITSVPVEIVKFIIMDEHKKILSFEKILNLFADSSSGIHNFFNDLLRTHFTRIDGDGAYFFECPAITSSNSTVDFEFVLIPSTALSKVKADHHAFSKHLAKAEKNQSVVTFPNIGGDSLLIVPCPGTQNYSYAHLADFIRSAPALQANYLWQKVAEETIKRLRNGQKLWISTSGLGVPWLHIRLDSIPKYYNFEPYQGS
jgi:hypothetical protein